MYNRYMDELEISGKRYISTRRAAKEYKYHADYIGQLIRGKKLLAKKVGRSWYVELESLAQYFGQEAKLSEPSQLVAKAVERQAEAQVVVPEPVVEERAEEVIVQEPVVIERELIVEEKEEEMPVEISVAPVVEEKETKINLQRISEDKEEPVDEFEESLNAARDSIHIPIRRPSFENPAARKQNTLRYVEDDAPALPRFDRASRASLAEVMPQTPEEAEAAIEDAVIVEAEKKQPRVVQLFSVAAVGGVVLVVVMFASVMVNSHLVKEAGKAASVEYSLQ